MPQFFVEPTQIRGSFVTLQGHEAKHLVKVLRHKIGDSVFLVDGSHQYSAVIESIRPKEVLLKLIQERQLREKAPSPALAIALLKHDHLEFVLQKGVELGIAEFILFFSERTIPHYHESITPKKITRFEKITFEAAKQSGMILSPKVHLPVSWEGLLKQFGNFSGVILAWEEEEQEKLQEVFQTIDSSKLLLIIGPEGGLTVPEVTRAKKAGAKIVSLGHRILRSETAAIALVSLCQYELGNI